MMYLHKEGRIAEYKMTGTVSGFKAWETQKPGFQKELTIGPGVLVQDSYESKEDALQAAMDYHEEEGCKLYLELYPAPDKGEWDWIAQDYDGEWNGFNVKPRAGNVMWRVDPEPTVPSHNHICESPPNPFWRKTLEKRQ